MSFAAGTTDTASGGRQKVEKLNPIHLWYPYMLMGILGVFYNHPTVFGVFATKEIAVAQIPTFTSGQDGRTVKDMVLMDAKSRTT